MPVDCGCESTSFGPSILLCTFFVCLCVGGMGRGGPVPAFVMISLNAFVSLRHVFPFMVNSSPLCSLLYPQFNGIKRNSFYLLLELTGKDSSFGNCLRYLFLCVGVDLDLWLVLFISSCNNIKNCITGNPYHTNGRMMFNDTLRLPSLGLSLRSCATRQEGLDCGK